MEWTNKWKDGFEWKGNGWNGIETRMNGMEWKWKTFTNHPAAQIGTIQTIRANRRATQTTGCKAELKFTVLKASSMNAVTQTFQHPEIDPALDRPRRERIAGFQRKQQPNIQSTSCHPFLKHVAFTETDRACSIKTAVMRRAIWLNLDKAYSTRLSILVKRW